MDGTFLIILAVFAVAWTFEGFHVFFVFHLDFPDVLLVQLELEAFSYNLNLIRHSMSTHLLALKKING